MPLYHRSINRGHLLTVSAEMIRLGSLRREHSEAAAGLTLAKLNSAFIKSHQSQQSTQIELDKTRQERDGFERLRVMEEKFSRFADGHGTILLEVVTPTAPRPRIQDTFPTTPRLSTPRTPMSFRLSELRPTILPPPLPQIHQLPTNQLSPQAVSNKPDEELLLGSTFEFPRPAPAPTPFTTRPSLASSIFRSASSPVKLLPLSPPPRSADLLKSRVFGRKMSTIKITSNTIESNSPSPMHYRRSNSNPDITTFGSTTDMTKSGDERSQWRLGHQTVISENDLEDLHLRSNKPVEFT